MPAETVVEDKPETKEQEQPDAAGAAEPPPPDEGDGKQEPEGTKPDLASVVADMSVDEVKAFIESLPKETRKEALAEIEASAEMRGRVRSDEAKAALTSRADAYETLIAAGERADGLLAQRINAVGRHMDAFEYDEAAKLMQPAAIAQLVEDYSNGKVAQVGKYQDAEVDKFRTKYAPYLKDLTGEQETQLADARHQDARKGTLSQLDAMVEIIIERVGAERETKGQESGKKSVDPALLERLEAFRELQGKLPRRVAGTRPAAAVSTATRETILAAKTPAEFEKLRIS